MNSCYFGHECTSASRYILFRHTHCQILEMRHPAYFVNERCDVVQYRLLTISSAMISSNTWDLGAVNQPQQPETKRSFRIYA